MAQRQIMSNFLFFFSWLIFIWKFIQPTCLHLTFFIWNRLKIDFEFPA
jgi:hypothetical protein